MRKDEDFWNYIMSFDFIGLCETWLEDKGWEGFKGRLSDTHTWENIHAVRVKRKRRARGDLLVGIRKDWGMTIRGTMRGRMKGRRLGKESSIQEY